MQTTNLSFSEAVELMEKQSWVSVRRAAWREHPATSNHCLLHLGRKGLLRISVEHRVTLDPMGVVVSPWEAPYAPSADDLRARDWEMVGLDRDEPWPVYAADKHLLN